ncbi:oxidoreductase [Lentibacillus kapialis]|uniref:Oxidoreductase n=1 Tax=Lentibacillus kapialis TaxID=340214 RepID=A0A917UYR2_9BACI|nr:gluconate 2-dehydrogenase subunit 3 family protein [Lentibacillus kapialis]GGJ97749.1 oxidoreductase [Lentibacillus kapialis]
MAGDKHSKDGGTHDESRRKFIKNTGMVAGGVVGGSLLGGLFTSQLTENQDTQTKSGHKEANFQEALQFFTRRDDFNVLQAATERIFPKNDHGPGAIGLGVPYYIDKQLAGLWGINGRDYRHSPFMPQTQKEVPNPELHPEQSALNRGLIFIHGLRRMNEESQKRFNQRFDEAEEDQQIEVMQDVEHDNVKMTGIAPSDFFFLLRQATLEGAYSDPLYGGNKNMEGWKMKNFPGAQPSYANVIEQDEFVQMEPISLTDYQGN